MYSTVRASPMIAALLAALLVSSQVYAADMALRATPGLAAMASAAGPACALAHSPSDFSSGFEDDASAAEVWSHPECSKDSGPQCHTPNRTCSLREIGNCSRSILEQSQLWLRLVQPPQLCKSAPRMGIG